MASLLDLKNKIFGITNPILQRINQGVKDLPKTFSQQNLQTMGSNLGNAYQNWQQKPSNQLVKPLLTPNVSPRIQTPKNLSVGFQGVPSIIRSNIDLLKNQTLANNSALRFNTMNKRVSPSVSGNPFLPMEERTGAKPVNYGNLAVNVGGLTAGLQASTGAGKLPIFSSRIDKKPRFEISDAQSYIKASKLKNAISDGITRLEEVFSHKGLYNKYPQLKKLRVVFSEGGADLEKGIVGTFNPNTFTVTLDKNLSRGDLRSTLIHEVQHSIQTLEGFSSGTTPSLSGITGYSRNASELEARSAQRRQAMTPDMRRRTDPFSAEAKATTGRVEPTDFTVSNGNQTSSLADMSKVSQETDPVQKIIQALQEAKPLEQKQSQIYSKIRSKQVGAIAGIGKNVPGEKGFFQQLSQLKGSMPKVQFESIRKVLDQPTIDELFNKVEQSNLSPFEKITAKSGLSKLLGAEGGSVPVKSELNLLNGIFPPEFIKAIQDKRPLMEKVLANLGDALNLPRAIMATADLSAPLRQGAFLIGRPKQWAPAFGSMFKYALSPKAYEGLAKQIESRPTYPLMRESRLALTDVGPMMSNREETFMSTLVDKIPGLGMLSKGSNRAYSGFLNKLRADTFDDLIKNAKQVGLKAEEIAPDIAKFVNTATGRGDLGAFQRAAPVLNGLMFSPRLLASRLNIMNPKFYADLDPFVRKEALKSLFAFAGTAVSVLSLAKLNGASVGTDPRSADFGKIKIGNTRYDILAGFQQPIRLAAQLITGKLISTTTGKEYTLGEGYKPLTRLGIIGNFLQSKQSPVVGFAAGMLQGTNSIGQPFDVPTELVSRFIPMIVQDMYDLGKEKGSMLQGVVQGLPGAFGVGVQTYGSQIPSLQTTPAGNTTVKLSPVGGLAEDIVAKIRGTSPSNIPQSQWAGIVQAKQQETLNKVQKDKVLKEAQAGNMQPQGNFVPVVVDGNVKVIDITDIQNIPQPPQVADPTSTLGKKMISKYRGKLTSIANDVFDLFQSGQLTAEQTTAKLDELQALSDQLKAPEKPKKITVKKVSVTPIKLASPKRSKIPTIKTSTVNLSMKKRSLPKLIAPETGRIKPSIKVKWL